MVVLLFSLPVEMYGKCYWTLCSMGAGIGSGDFGKMLKFLH